MAFIVSISLLRVPALHDCNINNSFPMDCLSNRMEYEYENDDIDAFLVPKIEQNSHNMT